MDKFATLDRAAHSGANGNNSKQEATLKQRIAGNYLKGRDTVYGLRIAIESPRGTMRHWQAEDGTSGSNLMKFHYGYIEGTLGNDGDELDCSIGPSPEAQRAYVVNQFAGSQFDEHKIMLGFPDKRTAEAGYLSNYTPGWQGMDSCVACSITQLKWWIAHGNKARPLTQDQLPYEGTDTMEKVLWDNANLPLHSTLDAVLYGLRAHDAADGLLFDAVSMADILADSDGIMIMDALVIPFARIEPRMQLMQKVLDRAGKTVNVAAMQVSPPFTQRGSTNVAVIYELSDGQTISVFFHNPDVTPKKIMPGDDLISWKWMLNKKDITVAVAPERGRDLEVRTVAARIMQLAEKNSARFIAANGKRAEKMDVIAGLKSDLEAKEATLASLVRQIEAATAEREAAGLDDPVDPILPAPEPEPAPAAAVLDIDGIKAVVTSENPMPGVSIGSDWAVMNAARPLMGTETVSNGEFLTGRFYAAIDPSDYMAKAYLESNVKMDASMVFVADAATLTAMTLQTISPNYLSAYMGMAEAERADAISGFMRKLNGRTYGELKALAALGMPVVASPDGEAAREKETYRDYLIYPLNIKSGDQIVPSFAVQTVENREREAAGERPIGGDSIHSTVEEARQEVDRMIVKAEADAKSQAEWAAQQAEATAKEAAARAEFEDVDGFVDSMSAMAKEKTLQVLNTVVMYRGAQVTRKALIRQKVADGFYIESDDGIPSLTDGDVLQTAKQLTKTGMDYAAYLIAKRPSPAVQSTEDLATAEAEKAAREEQDALEIEAARLAEVEAAELAGRKADEAADGDFLALAAAGDVDFYDKAITDRLAALAKKYTDPEGAYLDLVMQAKTAAKQFFVAEFKKKVA